MRLIDADALKEKIAYRQWDVDDDLPRDEASIRISECYVIARMVDDMPTVDAVPVIRCKDCKHRPVYDEQKREMPPMLNIEYDEDGEPWIWDDDMTCPYLCGDSYYNQMPDDEQFCDKGERKEHETDRRRRTED